MRIVLRAYRTLIAISLAMIAATAQSHAGVVIANAGFESPNLPGGYEYCPTLASQGGSGWAFSGGSGIAANRSGFGVMGANGDQAAFIQNAKSYGPSYSDGMMSQLFTVASAGRYTLSFLAEARDGYGANSLNVLIDTNVLSFNDSSTVSPASETSFSLYTSGAFTLSSGSYTLLFATANPSESGDHTTFIDDVVINTATVPEPSSILLGGIAILISAGGVLRRSFRAKVCPVDPSRAETRT